MNPIIDKIRKLQVLAERAGSEAEAANAAARVQELLAKHNLEIGSIALQAEEGSDEAVDIGFRRMRPHLLNLAWACNELFDVAYYWTVRRVGRRMRESRFHFVGLAANVEAARITFAYLYESVEALLAGWKVDFAHGRSFDRPAQYRSFRIGASERILEMASQAKLRAAASDSMLELIHIGKAVSQKMKARITFKGRRPSFNFDPSDYEAYFDGQNEASRVDIHGARKSRMLTSGT